MPDNTNPRSVRFRPSVERTVYTPETSTPITPSSSLATNVEQDPVGGSSDVDQESTDTYRDGIHVQLREPSVEFDLDGHIKPVGVFHESILNAPATVTRISTFLISSRSLPCKITVSRQHGYLTVRDVLDGIISSLRLPAVRVQHESRRTDRDLFLRVDLDQSIRWIDLLPQQERVFFGLSLEQGSDKNCTERILKVRN